MFDTRLKELRTGAGLTQAQLAKQLGVTQSTIGNWESGCRVPRTETARKVAAFFGVSTDYLLGEDSPVSFGPDGESMPDIYFRLAQGAKDPTRCGPSAGHRPGDQGQREKVQRKE